MSRFYGYLDRIFIVVRLCRKWTMCERNWQKRWSHRRLLRWAWRYRVASWTQDTNSSVKLATSTTASPTNRCPASNNLRVCVHTSHVRPEVNWVVSSCCFSVCWRSRTVTCSSSRLRKASVLLSSTPTSKASSPSSNPTSASACAGASSRGRMNTTVTSHWRSKRRTTVRL